MTDPFYTDTERNEILSTINKHIEKTEFAKTIGLVDKSDLGWIKFTDKRLSFFAGQENWITKLHNLIAPNRKNDTETLYHFKSSEIALKILSTKKIQLSALSDKNFNDLAELTEYHNRYGNDTLIPSHQTADYKFLIYILCLTNGFDNDYFWKEFNNTNDKICLGIKFSNIMEDPAVECKDVFYDTGSALDFLNDIRNELKAKFGIHLKLQSLSSEWAPYFYKRKKFDVEKETRVAINYLRLSKENRVLAKIEGNEQRYYIELDFANPFFVMTITELIVSKELANDKKELFKDFCKTNDILFIER